MFQPRHKLVAILLLAAELTLHAQSIEFNASSSPSPKVIRALLRSNDPRLIAWGAYFASRDQDNKSEKIMSQLAEHWMTHGISNIDAMSEVLYALIKRKKPVPPKALSAIATSFPNQALILASWLPTAEASPLLQKWYHANQDGNIKDWNDWSRSVLARVSAMMLAKSPPPGFAASILSKSEERLTVYVTDTGGVASGEGSSTCGDRGAGPPPPGWPLLYFYTIEENKPHTDDPVLVGADSDRITWHLFPITEAWGSCFGVRPLNDETRHHILATILGIPDKAMTWNTRQEDSIVWRDKESYLLKLRDDISAEETKLDASVEAFYAKGLLTGSKAALVRPKLLVTISDHRKAVQPPLPQLTLDDSRTYYAPAISH